MQAVTCRTLAGLTAGQRGVVHSLDGGRIFRSRAANLGFTEGAEVAMVQNFGHGPIIVSLRGTRVALGRAEAAQVFLEASR